MVQAHIFYSGCVQGVGFRYTAQQFASDLELSGWVKNLGDGRVEMIVQGGKEIIEQLCRDIENHFERNNIQRQIDFMPVSKSFLSFEIVY